MTSSSSRSLTQLLHDASAGDAAADASAFDLVYDELRRLAASALRRERPDHTLQPTALVHEVYLRLAGEPQGRWENRGHFLAVAARAMRRILVDHARAHAAQKRGSGAARLSLDDLEVGAIDPGQQPDLVMLDEALGRLSSLDPRQAKIVELRYFGGLSVEETASAVGTSPRTIKRDWQVARAWLRREMARLAPPA
jgi:RNA polymerase sigma factor (TIGR02999 family)